MSENRNTSGIAVIGMAVRAPGAADLEAFWRALIEGRDCISHFAAADLDPLVPLALRQDPHFVAARGVLEQAECFDATLFGMSANQARLMDPQQRVFLELCWHAFEHAGLDPLRSNDSIGVYAGSANNTWLQALRQTMPELIERNGEFAAMLANEKDYIATRIAHQFNLNGPAIGVYTACSSSLVAVAQAWYALMNYQCDVALAGGICVIEPQAGGYISVNEGMESPDGTCRPFDADANGTVFSSGGGCVVLKRVEDALRDGDTVHAVIRGVGLNNDGAGKASFTAPNPEGQAAAIRLALAQADADAASIGYVEAHGTGTALGDPIEVAALRDAFALDETSGTCVLGSVKGNIGHLTAAAGVVGLIKTVLCLERGQIPPTAHFRRPNSRIDFGATPFRVSGDVHDWPRGDQPRRAGVSSFGVGGTNAHVVLEEGVLQQAAATRHGEHLLPLSANGEEELGILAQRMATALAGSGAASLADIAWTLAQGRRQLPLRCAVVARDSGDAARQLGQPPRTVKAGPAPRQIWLFPGQGSQYPGMAAALWRAEPDFRAALEPLLAIADGIDAELRALLLEADPGDDEAAARLAQTARSQPALFLVSYAMARTLEAYGLSADAMIGHSIGEYVAACLAGVFTPEQALQLVARRGALMQAQPPGDMVAVHATVEALRDHLTDGIEIACYNADALQVVSGSHDAMQAQLAELERSEIRHSRLKVSHAFHSKLMEAALPAFAEVVVAARPAAPQRVFYACPDGRPITAGQAIDPLYWAGQIRAPVRFAESLRHALDDDRPTIFLEVGPGHALSPLARGARGVGEQKPRAVITVGAPAHDRDVDGSGALARALGEAWAQGAGVDLAHRYAGERRRQMPLPGYPFRREYFGYANIPAAAPAARPATPPAADGDAARAAIVALLSEVSGEPVESIDPGRNFVALGLDSLLLTQYSLALEQRLGLKLRFRRLLEDLDTPEKLAEHARAELPVDTWAAPAQPPREAQPAVDSAGVARKDDAGGLQALLASQLQMLEQQTRLLREMADVRPAPQTALPAATPARSPEPAKAGTKGTRSAGFGASARINLEHGDTLEPQQREWLASFMDRYTRRTRGSRDFTQRHRQVMADPRAVTGFDPRWKEMVYPIVVDRSSGARLWDVDGNEYIDLLNGFGSNFLGYQPPFIAEALHAQVDAGYEIGPQHPLAAEVSDLIARFTGLPRVALCNTGSEAVMGAMRIARTVTGRDTIAIFRDSYHGIFDEAVVRGTSRFEARPAAPGITASSAQHMLVLDYGSDEALDILRRRSGELAAILIEPIQARHPELRPQGFVRALREIADQAGCALIFDEVITGFRLEPGGAQAYYGVKADIGTYGKIIGGGLPFAAIAGQPRWMDALDGGDWRFGDDSQPEAGVTYFAGTFVRHPLVLAAACAALKHLEESGSGLQTTLNERTARLTERLNDHFRAHHAPIEAVSFSSMWRLRVDEDQPLASLLFYLLRYHGLHLYEQFGCFLSTAHGEAEVEQIATRIERAVGELLELGLLRPRPGQITPPATPAPAPDAERTGDGKRAPMTAGQLEKWVVCQHGKDALVSYNEGVLLHLEGDLDCNALRRALEDLWDRHEALRIAIDSERESQHVVDCPLPLAEVDLGGSAETDSGPAARLEAWSREQMGTPFDLDAAPLVRIHLLRLGENSHVLHLVGHHLVLDGWSLAVFVRELAVCYNARRAGRAPELPPFESFLAYARNERTRRETAGVELDYWQEELADAPAPLVLGRDDERGSRLSFDADTVQRDFPAASLDAVRARAGRASVTPFSVLISAFAILLWRLSGQRDLVVCIPFAGQAMAGAERMVGDGVNTLPLRIRVDPAQSLSQLLKQVHKKLLDAGEHQDTTLLSIARRLNERHLRRGEPLSRIIFNLNPRIAPPRFDGLVSRLRDCRRSHCAWDLFFNFYDTGTALTLDIHYDSARFDPEGLGKWMKTYAALLDGMHGDADPTVQDLAAALDTAPAPRAAAAHSIIRGTALPIEVPGVLELIERQVRTQPNRPAVIASGRTLDYAELWRHSGRLALHLAARGVTAGDPVGIFVPRDEQMPLALLAVLRSGGAYLPLDPDFPGGRLAHMIEHANLRHIVVGRDMPLPTALSGSNAQLHGTDDGLESAEADELPVANPDALAYLLYTSGSTGKPKGVRVLHRNLASFLAAMQHQPGMQADDKLCAVTTLSFDIAGLEMYLPLASGASIVIAGHDEVRDPERLLKLISGHEISVLQTTPSLLRELLAADASGEALRRVRLLVGGEDLPLDLARRAAAGTRELWNLYGPTETTIWSSLWRVPERPPHVAIGKPIAGSSVYVLDPDRRPVAPGTEGELWIGGLGVADGYLGRSDLTAERFAPDPFTGHGTMYRTGDLGRLENGLLFCRGRSDDQIKLRGHRIEPGEIEAVARTAAGVRDAAVAVREVRPGDSRLILYAVGDGRQDAESLRRTLARELPHYMQARHIVWLDALPRTPNGKLDRHALPVPADLRTATAGVKPRSASEALVVSAFNAVLGRSDIGIFDDFFDLGGHSLLAARLVANLRAAANVDLPLRNLFERPTPERLAAALDALAWSSGGHRPAGVEDGDREEIEL